MDSRPLPVPSSQAELTPDWLRLALASHFPHASVEVLASEQIGEGYGLASQLFRCRWQGSSRPRSVVVKLWNTDGPAGAHEVLFFRHFAARTAARVPACYHAAVDEETRRGVLVLEDLGKVSQGDVLQQLPLRHALALAVEVAALHASWWGRPELDEAGWLPSLSRLERDAGWIESRRERFLRRFGDRLDAFSYRLLEEIEPLQARANERLAGAEATLLHADLHLDNVVFEDNTQRPVLLDWARVAKGPAALDLVELLFSIGQDHDRILAGYLEGLRRQGMSEVDESSLRRQLGGGLLRKFIAWTCGIARWQPASAREAAMIDLGLQQVLQAVAEWQRQDPELFRF